MENLGKIHSFESFGTVDGPGIRYVVFMQGCHLKCKYCHNRDTWNYAGGTEYTTDEIISKIERCKLYINTSNGGVTVSGGARMQEGIFSLLQMPKTPLLCKKLGYTGKWKEGRPNGRLYPQIQRREGKGRGDPPHPDERVHRAGGEGL